MRAWPIRALVIGVGAIAVAACGAFEGDGPSEVIDDGGQWETLGTMSGTPDCSQVSFTFTDTDVIILGGTPYPDTDCIPDAFSLESETWRSISRVGAPPLQREEHVAVWTGHELILWGGFNGNSENVLPPGAYNPTTDTWRTMATNGEPLAANTFHGAIWTGSEVLVWNGPEADRFSAYDPVADSWRRIQATNPPSIHGRPAGLAWTGTAMALWGGWSAEGRGVSNDGGLYDPATDTWLSLQGGQPPAREESCMATVADQLVVWGGDTDDRDDGGIYNITTGEWKRITSKGALTGRRLAACGSTGHLYFTIGGLRRTSDGKSPSHERLSDGAFLDPATGRWYVIPGNPGLGAGSAHRDLAAFWDGQRIIVAVRHGNDLLGIYAYTPGVALNDVPHPLAADEGVDDAVGHIPTASSTHPSTTITRVTVSEAPTTSQTPPQATTPTTTTAPSTTQTTTRPSSTTVDLYYSVATHGLHPFPPLPGSGGWFGSGCSPGSDTLPDGIWWGYITDLSPSSVTFDLACLRWIDPPDDGFEGDGRWDIDNNNPKIRIVPVHPQAQAICLLWGCPPTPFPYTDWIEMAPVMPDMPDAGVWLYINDGEVTEVGEEVLAG